MSIKVETAKRATEVRVTDNRSGEVTRVVYLQDTQIGPSSDPKDFDVTGNATVRQNMFLTGSMFASGSVQITGSLLGSGSIAGPTTFVPVVAGGRLTLTQGTAVITGSVTSASAVYYSAYESNQITLFNGTKWQLYNFNEASLTLSGLTSGKNYDVFAEASGQSIALSLGAAWTSNTLRAVSLTKQDGVLVLSGTPTKRYLGTIRATSATQTEDSTSKRFVWNYYNRVERMLEVTESTDSWSYSSSTFRAANGSSLNCFEFVIGHDQLVTAKVNGLCTCASSGFAATVGIGIDSTSTNSATTYGAITNANMYFPLYAEYMNYPSVGYHKFTWLERVGAGTITFYGDFALPDYFRYGMWGIIRG